MSSATQVARAPIFPRLPYLLVAASMPPRLGASNALRPLPPPTKRQTSKTIALTLGFFFPLRRRFYGSTYWDATIDIQPWLPVPGTIIDRDDGSTVPFRMPSYMGQSFTQFCKLAPLVNRILHQRRMAPTERISFDLVEKTYLMLLQWADSLPIAMGPGKNMPPHVAIVQ